MKREKMPTDSRMVLWRAMSEAQFQAQVIGLATALGWHHYHDFDSRRSTAGYPDLTLVREERLRYPTYGSTAAEPLTLPGRLLLAELKTERGHLRPAQKQWLAWLRTCPGIEVYLWRPHDIDEIERILR